jgi:hypothetical protein
VRPSTVFFFLYDSKINFKSKITLLGTLKNSFAISIVCVEFNFFLKGNWTRGFNLCGNISPFLRFYRSVSSFLVSRFTRSYSTILKNMRILNTFDKYIVWGIFYVVIIQHVMISFPFCTPVGRAIVSFQTILRLFLFFFFCYTNLSA